MKYGPIIVGALAALALWAMGFGGILAEERGGPGEEDSMELVQAEGYALNTPFYAVADIDRSIKFYTEAIGLNVANVLKGDDGAAFHAEFQAGGQTILMIGPEDADSGTHGVSPNTGGYKASFNGYFYVKDVDAFYAHAVAEGAEAIEGPTDQFWGDRTAYVKDPDGYLWMLASKIAVAE